MAKPLLAPETILDTALTLLDAEGPEALSARSLAAELKCSTRTLYQQIGKRDQLIGRLIAHHFEGRELEFEHCDAWQDTAGSWAMTLRNTLLAHPNLSRLLTTQHRAPITDYVSELIRELLRAGFPGELALRSARVLTNITMSLTLSEINPGESDGVRARPSDREIRFAEKAARRSGKNPEAFQAPSEVFATAIHWVMMGIEQEFADHPPA